MKVKIQIIGYVSTLANGDTYAEVELPADNASIGDVLVELGKRYDERFNRQVYDAKQHVIHQVAMLEGRIIGYDTPVPDGATVQLTMMMDGGDC